MNKSHSSSSSRAFYLLLLITLCLLGIRNSQAQTYFSLSSGDYSQNFSDIANWTNNYASGTGASNWRVAGNATGSTGLSNTAVFVGSTSGGVQKGDQTLVFYATGTNSGATDLLLDFSGRISGNLSFSYAKIANTANNTSPRTSDLKIQYSSNNGTSFNDLSPFTVPRISNNSTAESGSINVALPSALNDQSQVVLRFFFWNNGQTSGSGNRPKWSIDDVSVTSTPSSSTAPTITSFSPASGAVGDFVTINGTNFAANATVSFNGTVSTNITFTNNNSLTATVPAGATSGPIRVSVGSENATSSSNFTVTNPAAPAINSTGNFTAFSAAAGNASVAQIIGVSGINLVADITASAPAGFEVSTDNSTFGPNAAITQTSGSASANLSVRIASSAAVGVLSGNLVLSSAGAASVSIPLTGNVTAVLQPSIVVISQVYGGGGNTGAPYRNDFVELFNPGNSSVPLNGWSIQFAGGTGTFGGANSTVALAGSIASKGYYLIQLAAGANTTVASLPAAEASGNFNLSATAFKVALVNSTTALSGTNPLGNSSIIDFVGAGSTANVNAFEGTGPAPAPSNTLAVLRKLGGEQDTNTNSADFETGSPNPRNSAGSIPAAAITSATTANATVGSPFTYTITASNTPASFAATGLPAGLSVNTATGVISGTPTTAGNTNATISATNAGGTGNATLAFSIAQGTPLITIPPTASAITIGQALGNSTLTGGNASVSGNFSFATPLFIPSATGSQIVIFTPDDLANYTTANTSVTVTVNPPPANPLQTWSGESNVTLTPQVLSLYAIGGGSYNGTVASEAPVLSTLGGNLSLTVIVRTNDPALSVTGETITALGGNWTILGNGTSVGVDQTGVAPGLERRAFRTPMGSDPKKFLRLRAVYLPQD